MHGFSVSKYPTNYFNILTIFILFNYHFLIFKTRRTDRTAKLKDNGERQRNNGDKKIKNAVKKRKVRTFISRLVHEVTDHILALCL